MRSARTTRWRRRRRTSWGVTAALGTAALLGACGGDDGTSASAASDLTLRLVIPDANIREPEVPCSGARAFRFAHPEADYVIEDPTGRQVASGTLPDGRAEKAFNIDLGEDRQPTVCVMMVDVQGVESLDGHALVIGDRTPLPIEPNQNLDDIPEVVLR